MKTLPTLLIIPGLLTITALFTAPAVQAQNERVEASTTTTTSAGTISQFGPQGLAITTPSGTQPVRFISNDTTNYVDEEGNPLPLGSVQPGMPATIHYTKVGDTLIASKIVVGARSGAAAAKTAVAVSAPAPATQATETTTTTTTTTAGTAGTIAEVVPGGFVVRSDSVTEPIRYRFSEKTVYVDEGGAPLTFEAVTAGLPVTVQYERVGDTLIATRVIVRRNAPVVPRQPATVTVPGKVVAPGAEVQVETRKETTTTTRER